MCSPRRPWRSCNREPRSHGNLSPIPCCAPASAFSAIFCPAASPMWLGSIHPTSKLSRAGFLGRSAAQRSHREFPDSAIDATVAANQIFSSGFPQGQLSCASPQANPATCLPPVAITAVPDGELHAPYFMEWSLGLEHQFGATGSVHAQYVGTRAVNQPYLTQVNGYQTVCEGCFAPFPYAQLHRSTIRSRHAIFHRREQSLQRSAIDRDEAHGTRPDGTNQLHLEPLHGHRLKRRIPAVFGRRNSLASPRRPGARLWSLRLRHPEQSQRAICLSIAAQGPKPHFWAMR